jgi:hypothetical protein
MVDNLEIIKVYNYKRGRKFFMMSDNEKKKRDWNIKLKNKLRKN